MTEAPTDQPEPAASTRSHTYQLADLLLKDQGGIEKFVRSRRADGVAWRRVARDLYLATDGRIDVAHETIRLWLPEDDAPEAAAS